MKKLITVSTIALLSTLGLTGCVSDADVASENLSKSAEQFEINRRIVFFNGITDKYPKPLPSFPMLLVVLLMLLRHQIVL